MADETVTNAGGTCSPASLQDSVERIHQIRATLMGALSIAHKLQEDLGDERPESVCRLVVAARDDLYDLTEALSGMKSVEVQHV